jgi:hypothetical protein
MRSTMGHSRAVFASGVVDAMAGITEQLGTVDGARPPAVRFGASQHNHQLAAHRK